MFQSVASLCFLLVVADDDDDGNVIAYKDEICAFFVSRVFVLFVCLHLVCNIVLLTCTTICIPMLSVCVAPVST